ncbi:MAG TPA: tetratricopeptide repeat protein [Candidatus Aminicenantes bacterium]|nr:tetratricopeptide repeat protein [Candidatus Aminicenantes bacterium]
MIARHRIVKTAAALFLAAGLAAARGAAPAGPGGDAAAPQKKASKKLPDEKDPKAQYERGVVALRYGLTDEAIRYGERAVELDASLFDGWNLLGSAYYAKSEFARSAEAYEKAAALRPAEAGIQKGLGLAYLELGEFEKAEAALKKAIAAEDDSESAFQLGKLCYNAKRFDEALAYALSAIRKDGRSARAYNLKGVTLNQLGRYPEAAGSFQAGLVLAPDDVGLSINLGIAYLNSGEPAKAKAVFEAVLPKIDEDRLRGQVEDYIKSIKDRFVPGPRV